jgi:hypothetical protein
MSDQNEKARIWPMRYDDKGRPYWSPTLTQLSGFTALFRLFWWVDHHNVLV